MIFPQIYLEISVGLNFTGKSIINQYLKVSKKFVGIALAGLVCLTFYIVHNIIIASYYLVYAITVYYDGDFYPKKYQENVLTTLQYTKTVFYSKITYDDKSNSDDLFFSFMPQVVLGVLCILVLLHIITKKQYLFLSVKTENLVPGNSEENFYFKSKLLKTICLAPFLFFGIILMRVLALEGSQIGIIYLIVPNVRKLIDWKIWIDAFLQ